MLVRRLSISLFGLISVLLSASFLWLRPPPAPASRAGAMPRLSRPYGMAPAAFNGFVRACLRAKIHPFRIGQTIGDHPLSVGYHHRDGVVFWHRRRLDYSAAVDLGVSDLTPRQRNRFLEALASQGFAAFYRQGGKWRGHEHVHSIYAPLHMKQQLQAQMREWEWQRRRMGKRRYRWQKRWARNWR